MDEEFDWSDFWKDDIVEENEGEDSGEGAHDEGDEISGDVAETETIESANSTSEDTQEQSSTVEEQEANTNTINETEAELEDYGTPVDLSWISTSDLSEEEKTDFKVDANTSDNSFDFTNERSETKADTKADTKVEAAKEEASQYPNGMTKEEFNAMYEFALGMTGRGGNQVLDDFGDPTGFWGDFETIPLTIEEAQQDIQDLQARYETLESRGTLSETQASNIQAEIKENEANLAAAQEQLDTLNAFIDNYANLYTPIEREESKNQVVIDKVKAAEKEFEQATDAQETAWANLTQALMKAGMDYSLSAEDVLASSTSKFELSKENKNYASKAAESIVKAISQKGFKGGNFTLPVDTSAKEYGSYLIQTARNKGGIGVSLYDIRVISPKGDVIATGTIGTPSGWSNGTWNIKGAKGNTIASGESTSAFVQSITKALSNVAITDYENSKSTSSVPDDVRAAAQAVIDAQNNYADKEDKLMAAQKEMSKATHATATESKQDIMNKYARGELNPYQAAVALTNIKDSAVLSNYDRITSAINYDNFKDAGKIAGSTGKGTVGITSLTSDLMPASRDNPTSATNISKEITMEFKNLNELKNALTKVDTSTAKDLQSFNDLKTQVEDINTQLDQLASSTFLDLAKELLGKGVDLAELDNQPEMQQLNNEIYAVAQMVLDKASELKEISGQYGLNNLTMKDLRENKELYTAQVALITGKNGTELLDKSDMKALVNYSKSLDATIDSAKALMTAAAVLHGAQDVQGGKYAQAWKAEKVETKMTAKDWLATAATSTADLLATVLGFGMVAVNPLVGGALAYAGTKGLIEQAGKTSGKTAQATLTNYERMFGSQDKKGASIISAVYDRGFNKANYGDVRSVGTYTTIADATIDAINAMALLTNPATAVAGLGVLYKAGKAMTVDLAKGSYEGKKNNLITNVWRLVENIEDWADTNLDSQQLAELINAGATVDTFDTEGRTERREGKAASSDYGTTKGEVADNADRTYSGASEQAKNVNLAKDYNAGMEQEVNEAVSDKYTKVFKVMIDKEPDYIRKVLIAIPKMHSEREW